MNTRKSNKGIVEVPRWPEMLPPLRPYVPLKLHFHDVCTYIRPENPETRRKWHEHEHAESAPGAVVHSDDLVPGPDDLLVFPQGVLLPWHIRLKGKSALDKPFKPFYLFKKAKIHWYYGTPGLLHQYYCIS